MLMPPRRRTRRTTSAEDEYPDEPAGLPQYGDVMTAATRPMHLDDLRPAPMVLEPPRHAKRRAGASRLACARPTGSRSRRAASSTSAIRDAPVASATLPPLTGGAASASSPALIRRPLTPGALPPPRPAAEPVAAEGTRPRRLRLRRRWWPRPLPRRRS